jgi:hypothetical protein
MTPGLKAAQAYCRRGLAVLPLSGKVPVTEHGVQDASRDSACIEQWFAADYNIGIAIPEGVVVVDIDPRNGGLDSWIEWLDAYGVEFWNDEPCAETGGGGYHYWFRLPDGVDKLKKNIDSAPGIDLLTHGRYVVAPPSVTDEAYVWATRLPDNLDDLSALPGFIEVLARVEERQEVTHVPRVITTTGVIGGDPLDDAAHAYTSWESLLTGAGWKHVGGDKWRHPLSDNQVSATIKYDCLFVYSPNTPFPVTEPGAPHGVTLYNAILTLAFNGDQRAMLHAFRDAGHLPQLPRSFDLASLIAVDEKTDECMGDAPNSTDDEVEPTDAPGSLPRISVTAKAPRDLAEQSWVLLVAANEPPRLFVSGGRPVRVERDDDGFPILQPWTVERTLFELSYVADWLRPTMTGWKPVGPPYPVAKQVLATPEMPLPSLVRLVEAPVFAPDGTLQTEAGYHAASRTLYVPAPGFDIPPVPEQPTIEELERAKAEIAELLCDFPFADQASYAHAVGLLVLPFVRDLIGGPTPLHLFDKPVPGSGASLLVHVLLAPALGHAPPFGTDSNTDEEWRKRITAALMKGPMAVVLDNLTGELRSPALMAAITSSVWEDRILGRSEMGRWPIRCVWVATSNNLTLKRDLVRRTVYCRLDPNTDHPEDRTGFRHELPTYAYERRPQLVWAILTTGRAWLAAGRPQPDVTPLGSFEDWTRVIGGILDVLEIPGFLTDRDTLRSNTDTEHEAEDWLLETWWRLYRDEDTTVAKLFTLIEGETDVPIDLLKGNVERQWKASLGARVRDLRDRVFTLEDGVQVRVEKGTKVRGSQRWHLRPLTDEWASAA